MLKYHVVVGRVVAAVVLKFETAKTVLGQVLTIDSAAEVMVDDATVVKLTCFAPTTSFTSLTARWCPMNVPRVVAIKGFES